MKKIKSISLSSLRVEEDFGFLKLIVSETGHLGNGPGEGEPTALTASIDSLKKAVDNYDEALKDSAAVPSSAIAAEADAARDNAWRGANNYLKAMTAHPTDEVSAAASEVKSLFDKYGDPTTLPQTEESGIFHNLLQDLKAIDNGKRSAIAFEAWLENLESCESAFLAAVSQRTTEEAARQVGVVKERRKEADEAYRLLVEKVNALAIVNGDADYATFIDRVNVIIDRQKAVMKARATNAKKQATDGK